MKSNDKRIDPKLAHQMFLKQLGKSIPVNNVEFTSYMLERLHIFIESELISKLNYFCDYDKQALLDAVYYLNEYEKLVKIMEIERENLHI